MPRSQAIAGALFTAFALSFALALGSCGNSSTTYACDGSASCHAGLALQSAAGDAVKLHIGGFEWPFYGTVMGVDEDMISLEMRTGGQFVARWSQVTAWESGGGVSKELSQAELMQRYVDFGDETNESVLDLINELPGADRD